MSGTTSLHLELEETIAEFVGKPAAMVYGMGFATNSTTLPVLMDKVCFKLFRILYSCKSAMVFGIDLQLETHQKGLTELDQFWNSQKTGNATILTQ